MDSAYIYTYIVNNQMVIFKLRASNSTVRLDNLGAIQISN